MTSAAGGMLTTTVAGLSQETSPVDMDGTSLPRPQVTAHQVVDRETLAAFVEAASREYQKAAYESEPGQLANVRSNFRQEGGDWTSDEVYVFIISTNGYTLFHGTQPAKFEGIDLVCDECMGFFNPERQDVNGVHYLKEIMAAGEAGGGFVEYMFDNPSIEGDEESGSRKVAYATGFTAPGTNELIIVASGFYPDS